MAAGSHQRRLSLRVQPRPPRGLPPSTHCRRHLGNPDCLQGFPLGAHVPAHSHALLTWTPVFTSLCCEPAWKFIHSFSHQTFAYLLLCTGPPWWFRVKESSCSAGAPRSFLGRKIPCRREWLLTPVFLPGELHGQRSLVGYSPWGCKEMDMAEQLSLLGTW